MVQYPHTLNATVVSAGTRDGNGDYIPGTNSDVNQPCRYESSDGGGYITGSDGKRIDFSGIVYMPLSSSKVAIGTNVKIYDKSELIITDTVKRFLRGQLNCRAWL